MSKFRDFWKKANLEKDVSPETLSSYIKRLGISAGVPSSTVDATRAKSKSVDTSFAGGVPVSLLAGQDLEGPTTKTITIQKEGSDHDLTIEIHNGSEETAKAVFEGCEMSAIMELETYMDFQVFVTPEMADADGKKIGCYVVVGPDGSLQVFFSLKDARDYIDSVLVVNKSTVEETGKDLVEMAQAAKEGDEDTQDLVRSITAVQRKRQKATIAQREKDAGPAKKSFKENWASMTKMDGINAIYKVTVLGPNGMCVFDRWGLTYDDMVEVLETVKQSYKGHVIECTNDMGYREVFAPK